MSIPFSIIIPVYNDERNLDRCISSVISQTFQNFEILLINDGSTDSCPALCDEYAQKDKRIQVFHKDNEGISKTRQFGIDKVKGEYIFFLDSDDWIEPSFVSDTLSELRTTEADVLFFDFFKEISCGKEKYNSQNPSELNTENILRLVLERKLSSCLWNIVISKDFYLKNKINFKDGINFGEDTLFMLELLLKNPQVSYIPKAYYHHSYNKYSFTRTNKKYKYYNRIEFLGYLPVFLEDNNRNDLLRYNCFPINDKFDMLCSGVFTKNELKNLYSLSLVSSHAKKTQFPKYFLLVLAEKCFYSLAKSLALFLRNPKLYVLSKFIPRHK